ncbi:MAG: hypothetical protein KDA79_02790 [Planctomycetaceae bacterium]|nr:hypothetical protein [Planctomycetaceae bacterium]
MTRRTRQSAQSVSLFPFLAVLVCAMGVLIFLLIVTTSRIRTESLARAAEELQRQLAPPAVTIEETPEPVLPQPAVPEPAPPAPQQVVEAEPVLPEYLPNDPVPPEIVQTVRWPDPDEPLRQKIQQLTAEREALRQQHEQLTIRLRSAKELAAKEQARVAQQQQAVKSQSTEAAVQAAVVAALEQQKKKTELEIRRLGREIEQTQARVASEPSRFSLVAYDGASGTTRRPILVECTSEGIRFLPEDVMITEEDLIGFTEGYNPVLAGAKSLTEYWLRHDEAADGKPPAHPPYVLLLVRQSGSLSYYVTRRLLEGLGQPFGYELLPDDFPLAPPAVDPRAREVCRAAVSQLLEERQELLARLTQKYGAGSEVRVGRNGFDLVELQESAAAGKQLTGSLARTASADGTAAAGTPASGNMAAGNTATSGSTGASGNTASTGTAASGTTTSGSETADLGGLFGRPGADSSRQGQPLAATGSPAGSPFGQPNSGTGIGAAIGDSTGTGSGSDRKPGTGTDGSDTLDFGALSRTSPGQQNSAGTSNSSPAGTADSSTSGTDRLTARSTADPAGSGSLNKELFGTGESENSDSRTAEAGGRGAVSTAETPGDLPAGSTPGSPESLADAFQLPRGGSAAELRNLDYAERNRTAANSGSGTALNQFSRPQSSFREAGSGNGSPSRQTASAAGNQSGSAGSSTGSSGARSSGSSGSSPFQSAGSRSRSRSRGGVEFPDFGAAMRKRGIGYERELTVALQADQALIGGNIQLRLGRGETATELSRQVLDALEQKVATWGEPPEGFYWVPRLRVQISPGGNLHYSRLRDDIARWGLETTVEQRLESIPDPAASSGPTDGKPTASGLFSDR